MASEYISNPGDGFWNLRVSDQHRTKAQQIVCSQDNRLISLSKNCAIYTIFYTNILYTGWVKKSVIWVAWCKIVPFLCNSPLWKVFFQYYLKICKFLLVLQWPKKSANLFSFKIKMKKSWNFSCSKNCNYWGSSW